MQGDGVPSHTCLPWKVCTDLRCRRWGWGDYECHHHLFPSFRQGVSSKNSNAGVDSEWQWWSWVICSPTTPQHTHTHTHLQAHAHTHTHVPSPMVRFHLLLRSLLKVFLGLAPSSHVTFQRLPAAAHIIGKSEQACWMVSSHPLQIKESTNFLRVTPKQHNPMVAGAHGKKPQIRGNGVFSPVSGTVCMGSNLILTICLGRRCYSPVPKEEM